MSGEGGEDIAHAVGELSFLPESERREVAPVVGIGFADFVGEGKEVIALV